MPLPASVPVGTVTGRYYEPDGDNATGTAYFLLLNEIEVPDDPDGVVIPLMTKAVITAGVLNVTLPAGFYNARVRLGDWYEKTVVIEVEQGVALNLPDAIDVVPPEELLTPVRSVNGVLPDASGNIEISAGGGGAVSSVFGRTGAVLAQSGDYTKEQVGLGNVDNTSDLSKPVSTATQTALDAKADDSDITALQAQVGRLKRYSTTGQFVGNAFGPCGLTGTWTVSPNAFRLSIPASVGDILIWTPSAVLGTPTASSDAEFDLASVNNTVPASPVILRTKSSGTNTPLANGDGGMYCWSNNARRLPTVQWVVSADDIVSGTVTLALLYRASATGLSVGHATVYPSSVSISNLGTPLT